MQLRAFPSTARGSAPSRSGHRLALALSGGLLLAGGLSVAASAQPGAEPPRIARSAAVQMRTLQLDQKSWTEAENKLDSEILFALKRRRGDAFLARLPELRTGRELAARGLVDVEIVGTLDEALVVAVEQMGTVLSSRPEHSVLRARLSLEAIQALAERSDVRRIRRDLGFELRKDNTSQGDVAHKADQARSVLAVDGTGVTIGVLSDGIDTLADRQATGDLPAVNVISGQAGTGDEGTAMLEVVYDLAPGATLYFATASSGEAQFATNIAALQAAGCDIIVDGVFYFSEATFQDDVIAQAVNAFTAAGGLYFSSAGNSGNLNDGTSGVWEGDFSSSSNDPIVLAGADTHDFGVGSANVITVDSPSLFILQWSDPLGGSANDYDLYLLNPAGTGVLTLSAFRQDGDDDPFEFITSDPFDDTNNLLAIVRFAGAGRFLWLSSNGGRLSQATSGQTSGHATAADAFGVAAVNWFFAAGGGGAGVPFDGTESVETFSSDGPRRVFFEADGTPLTPGNFSSTGGEVRNQPKLAAADGVSTAAPGFAQFLGTSAAAAHAAAIAALLLENSALTPAGLEQVVAATALDIEAAGFDRDSGHGIVEALALVNVTLPGGLGGTPPSCAVDDLTLTDDPNDGPQTFRACESITASAGEFDDLTMIAYDTVAGVGGRIILGAGFQSAGPLVLRTTSP